jgi:type IX secretion system PorP/SprF family membrane protein
MYRKIFLISILLLLSLLSFEQDVHYSQWDATPLFTNPALTGNGNCSWRTGVNYRTQDQYTKPFETYNAFIDKRIKPGFVGNHAWLGLGTNLYYDNAGDGPLKKIQAMLFMSYSKGFNSDNTIYGSMGAGLGITNRQIENNYIFDNQWNGTIFEFDPGFSSGEDITKASIFYPDFNFGLHYHHQINKTIIFEIGSSLNHINRPIESFFTGEENRMDRKSISYLHTYFKMGSNILINPSAYYIWQNEVDQLLMGSNFEYTQAYLTLSAGIWYRYQRDIIPLIGIEYHLFKLQISYDVNISKEHTASNYKGGMEISLVKSFCSGNRVDKTCKSLQFH